MFAASKTDSASEGYQISRSLRFNSADSAYLTRTPASAGNRKTYTISVWCKRASTEGTGAIISARTGAPWTFLGFSNGDGVGTNPCLQFSVTAGTSPGVYTNSVLRDLSAWYHIVLAVDTTQATASNRVKIYINSVLQTLTSGNYPTLNQDTEINNTIAHEIGNTSGYSNPSNFYLTEYNFIDGQALTPSSFGETNAQTGVWQPKAFVGTYGTNGFYLNFSDNSNTTAATLGKDYSGNGNNFTPNNFSVTAGAGNDSMVDVPTPYGVDTGAGGTVRGNYCTLNPLAKDTSVTVVNGNLNATNSTINRGIASTIYVSTGKWYAEFTCNSNGVEDGVGIMQSPLAFDGNFYQPYQLIVLRTYASVFYSSATNIGAPTWVSGDIIQVKLDLDNQTVGWAKNGGTFVTINITSYDSHVAGQLWTFGIKNGSAGASGSFDYTINFGQRPFAYTAPSGFQALCTQNLPTPTIGATTATQAGKYFNAVTYTGTGSSLGVTGVGFQPDWVWVKGRSGATNHSLYDVVRGVQKQLESNTTDAETTQPTGLTAFGSDGFTVGALAQMNTSAATYVAWNWKANGAGSTNTTGTITSTVSANTTAGFSVLTYTSNGTVGATIGHGLGTTPAFVIVIKRNAAHHPRVGTSAAASASAPIVGYLTLPNALGVDSATFTSFNSTTIVVGNGGDSNSTSGDNYVMYCFAPIANYSAIGSYTGNGSADGIFIYTGFKPAFVIVKRTDTTGDWPMVDSARDPYNVAQYGLYANSNYSEASFGSPIPIYDFNSNGFKIRNTFPNINASGGTYIYMAFASNPFKYSLAR